MSKIHLPDGLKHDPVAFRVNVRAVNHPGHVSRALQIKEQEESCET